MIFSSKKYAPKAERISAIVALIFTEDSPHVHKCRYSMGRGQVYMELL